MIGTVVRVGWLTLARDRVALVLTFVLPLVFFSVFASVFGAMDSIEPGPVRALVVLEDDHPLTELLGERLSADPALEILDSEGAETRRDAERLVRAGTAQVAIVLPDGLGAALADPRSPRVTVEILADRSDPLAPGVATARVEHSALLLAVRLLGGLGSPGDGASGQGMTDPSVELASARPLDLRVVDVLGAGGQRPSIAFFAAGLGVMFLMFATGMRGGLLLDEKESGVLTRLLAARMTIGQLLLGRWLFLVALGFAQVSVMFVWAALAFGLELWSVRRLLAFSVVTLASAGVAASFGLLLSAVCRSRAQLTGVTTVTVLVLCALGGNMFPSFLMPENLQRLGMLTFNAWALSAYQRVFWYEARAAEVWPQLAVLAGFAVLMFVAAQVFASRWRTG
jgi:ABC-2 type transport system permease protein